MYFRDHLVDVVPEFVNAYFLFCRYEYARCFFLRYPAVFQFFKRSVRLSLRFKGKFVVLFVLICIYLIENDIYRLIVSLYVPQRLLHYFHLFLETWM